MNSRGILLSAGSLLFSFAAIGQTLTNLKASFDGEKMVVTYDLIYSDPNQKFKVSFYSSHDNYGRALSLITGDAGESVSPGQGNRVVWDVKNTLPADFEADITIKIKASRVGGAVKLATKPFAKSGYKPGETVTLQWVGGDPGGKVNVELFRNDERQMQLAQAIPNSQEYKWVVPKGLKGKDYVLRVTSASNNSDLSNSQAFAVKPKIPLYLIIIPAVVIVGGGVAVALAGGGDPPPPPGDEELPGPVKPN